MNELIKIMENEGQQAVSSRALYEFLEVKRDFTNWCKQMFEYGFEEDKDFTPILAKSTGGRPSVDYALTFDCAKEISMLQRTDKGKQARQYFIECEKKAKETVKPSSISTLDYLKLVLKGMEENHEEIQEVKKDVASLKAHTSTESQFYAVMGYARLNNLKLGDDIARSIGIRTSKLCKERGILIDSTHHPRYGRINTYPESILEEVFNEMGVMAQ
jgi:anti-repressor protein